MGDTPLRLVVLDNNGTCFDDLHIAFPSACACVAKFAPEGTPVPTLQQYRDEMDSNWREWYYRYGVPRSVTGDQMNESRRAFYAQHVHTASYRSDVLAFLGFCRGNGLKVAMVSAELQSMLYDSLSNAGLMQRFDYIRAQAWPKTPALVRTLVQLGIFADQAVYVDDSVEGIRSAKTIGMRTIGFANPTAYASKERIVAVLPDAMAEDFDNVSRILLPWM